MCTESYSMITMPNADSHVERTLQEDNTELAYECKLRRLEPRPTNHASPCAPCAIGSRAQVPWVYRGKFGHQRHPRGTHSHALALRPNTTHAYASVPQVAARRFCLVAAGARQPSPPDVLGFKLTCVPPCLAQTTRSSRRCNSTQFLLNLCTPFRPPGAHPFPFHQADQRECGEAPVRLTSNRSPHRPTWLGMTFAPPRLRRMGEISMCAASYALPWS